MLFCFGGNSGDLSTMILKVMWKACVLTGVMHGHEHVKYMYASEGVSETCL